MVLGIIVRKGVLPVAIAGYYILQDGRPASPLHIAAAKRSRRRQRRKISYCHPAIMVLGYRDPYRFYKRGNH